MEDFKKDHENYEKLRQPFESKLQAQTNLEAFLDAVIELRTTYQIPDVVIVTSAYFTGNGQTKRLKLVTTCGDYLEAFQLVDSAKQEIALVIIELMIKRKAEKGEK